MFEGAREILALVGPVAVSALGWWLRGRFHKLEIAAAKRHEKYLEKFSQIDIRLARMENGHRR